MHQLMQKQQVSSELAMGIMHIAVPRGMIYTVLSIVNVATLIITLLVSQPAA